MPIVTELGRVVTYHLVVIYQTWQANSTHETMILWSRGLAKA